MCLQTITDDEQRPHDLTVQSAEKLQQLRLFDRAREQPEVKLPESNPRNGRELFLEKLYCSTGIWPRGAKVRTRVGRSRNHYLLTETMV